jgi:hypothetical protein
LKSHKNFPRGLKARFICRIYGTAEAVPFQNICASTFRSFMRLPCQNIPEDEESLCLPPIMKNGRLRSDLR